MPFFLCVSRENLFVLTVIVVSLCLVRDRAHTLVSTLTLEHTLTLVHTTVW